MESTISVKKQMAVGPGEMKLGLDNITALMKRLKNPENQLRIIHVAGTNGKGSVCQMLGSILQEAGYKVGSFNSPHLIVPEECIRINGEQIASSVFDDYMEGIQEKAQGLELLNLYPSYFEMLTALGFLYFKEQGVDFVILEVGLGGTLDATNVIQKSEMSILTKISIDHKDILGDTLEAIAKQKAGIIKPSGLVVAPLQEESINQVIQEVCASKQAELRWMNPGDIQVQEVSIEGTVFWVQEKPYQLKMIGKHQAYNASIALQAISVLKEKYLIVITGEQIRQGLYKATWQGRIEKISEKPLTFIDGAHNVDGIGALADTLEKLPSRYTIGIVGILRDKEVEEMLDIISEQVDEWIVTEPDNPRAMSKEELAKKLIKYNKSIQISQSVEEAVEMAVSRAEHTPNSQVIAFGSLYMIGHVRTLFM